MRILCPADVLYQAVNALSMHLLWTMHEDGFQTTKFPEQMAPAHAHTLASQAMVLSGEEYTTDNVSDKIFHLFPKVPATIPWESSPVKALGLRHYLLGTVKVATPFVHALLWQRLYVASSLNASLDLVVQNGIMQTASTNGYRLEDLMHSRNVKV